MKYLILLALLSACASTPDPKPVYDSVYGDWKFSNKDVSGSFTIDNDIVKNGVFTVLGKTLVADERKILFRGGLAFNIELVSSNKGFVVLELCEPSTKYDTLLSAQYSFGTTSENRVITKTFITR